MSPRFPELVTYASTLERAKIAVMAGIQHLILEDPNFSIRTFHPHPTAEKPGNCFADLIKLIAFMQANAPQIELSFNLDLIPHQGDRHKIEQLLQVLNEHGIHTIRLQDPGLHLLVEKIMPARFHLNTETGNNNLESIKFFTQQPQQPFTRIVLSNDLPHNAIQEIVATLGAKIEFEFQVQGPILLQYSQRRLTQGALHPNLSPLPQKHSPAISQIVAQQIDKPGHLFPLYDNAHGHFMYYRCDKCLLDFMPELCDLHLTAWLIDARGESDAYLTQAVATYKQAMARYLSAPQNWVDDQTAVQQLLPLAQRPFIRGFFLKNNTDKMLLFKQRAFEKLKTDPSKMIVALILGVERPQWVIIEAQTTLQSHQELTIATSENLIFSVSLQLFDLDGQAIPTVKDGDLCLVPWKKGMVPGSIIYQLTQPIESEKRP